MGTAILLGGSAQAIELGSPVDCTIGQDCFIQQYPDMDSGSGSIDPFCESATYDGHDGTDVRVPSLKEMDKGVAVISVADGKVLRVRDAVADHLALSSQDQRSVEGTECGNGLVMENADGYETQYCHLKRGSVVVSPGETVKRGTKLGLIGASGLAEFPHVHLTVRHDGKAIDPTTGHAVGSGCVKQDPASGGLFSPDVEKNFAKSGPEILGIGLTDAPVTGNDMVQNGKPQTATVSSAARVGWVWLINLRKGDDVIVRLVDPTGKVDSQQQTNPMERSKAVYVAFAGRKRPPEPGTYKVEVEVRNGENSVLKRTENVVIR